MLELQQNGVIWCTYQSQAMSPQGILFTIFRVSRAAVTQMTADFEANDLLRDTSSSESPSRFVIKKFKRRGIR